MRQERRPLEAAYSTCLESRGWHPLSPRHSSRAWTEDQRSRRWAAAGATSLPTEGGESGDGLQESPRLPSPPNRTPGRARFPLNDRSYKRASPANGPQETISARRSYMCEAFLPFRNRRPRGPSAGLTADLFSDLGCTATRDLSCKGPAAPRQTYRAGPRPALTCIKAHLFRLLQCEFIAGKRPLTDPYFSGQSTEFRLSGIVPPSSPYAVSLKRSAPWRWATSAHHFVRDPCSNGHVEIAPHSCHR